MIVSDLTFPIAMIDAQDLADWIVRSAEGSQQGTFNAIGHATTLAEVFAISRELTASQATVRPVTDEQLLVCGVNRGLGRSRCRCGCPVSSGAASRCSTAGRPTKPVCRFAR